MVVADGSFLIDLLTGRPAATEVLRGLQARMEPIWIPTSVLVELYYSVARARDATKGRAKLLELERLLPHLRLDAPSARLAGELRGSLANAGKAPSTKAAEIAAIAMLRQEGVVTADKGFPRPSGLTVLAY